LKAIKCQTELLQPNKDSSLSFLRKNANQLALQ